MGESTGIAWTHHTFNGWWGCTKVSPECDSCYAETWDARFGGANWGHDAPRRFFGDKHWNEPFRWNRAAERNGERRLVFCSSMADVFEKRADLDPWRQKLWALIKLTPHLTWLLLTKRPQFISTMLDPDLVGATNVWCGTTVGTQDSDWRVDALINHAAHAPVRFLSMEPILGPVDVDLDGINWVVQGTESGDRPRPAQTDWLRKTRDACAERGVPYLLKQADEGMGGISMHPMRSDGVVAIPDESMQTAPWRKRDLRTGPDGMKRVHYIIERPYLDGRQHVEFPK